MADAMFTQKEEAIHYVKDILLIKDVLEKLQSPNQVFLDEIIKAHNQMIPFTSLQLLSIPPDKRSLPSMEMIKKSIFEKQGGLCYINNTFMFYLLQAIGYNVKFYMASVDNRPMNHPIVIATIKDGDLDIPYLVDVATGYPMFQAVPLNFEEESLVYENSYLKFKYIKQNGKILRLNGTGHFHPHREGVTQYIAEWRIYYEFEMYEVTQKFIDDKMADTYRYDPTANFSPFHISHRTLAYPEGKCIGFKDDLFLTEQNGKLVFTKMDSLDDIREKITTHFPQFSVDIVNGMLENWQKERKSKGSNQVTSN